MPSGRDKHTYGATHGDWTQDHMIGKQASYHTSTPASSHINNNMDSYNYYYFRHRRHVALYSLYNHKKTFTITLLVQLFSLGSESVLCLVFCLLPFLFPYLPRNLWKGVWSCTQSYNQSRKEIFQILISWYCTLYVKKTAL